MAHRATTLTKGTGTEVIRRTVRPVLSGRSPWRELHRLISAAQNRLWRLVASRIHQHLPKSRPNLLASSSIELNGPGPESHEASRPAWTAFRHAAPAWPRLRARLYQCLARIGRTI